MQANLTTDVNEAATALRHGRLVAFATETVYGLGADALDPTAVARIFEAKQRPAFDPLIVHIADRASLSQLVSNIPTVAEKLMDRFWPGPLTLVLPKTDRVPDLVTSGLPSVGVRMPAHPQARQLIAAAGRPIAAPSANLFGRVSPTTAAHVAEQLGDRIDMILDGGPCSVGVESTVLDLSGDRPVLLRPGGLPLESMEEITGPIETAKTIPAGIAAPGPGMLERHYAPGTPVILWRDGTPIPSGRVGLLGCQLTGLTQQVTRSIDLSPTGDLVEAASRLFASLRELDTAGLDLILARPVPEAGLGRAINDRLRRAAAR